MFKREPLGLLIFLFAALNLTNITAQSRYSEKAQAELTVREDKINAELFQLPTHEWAGEYSKNGQFLSLAPKSGFAYYKSGGDDSRNWDNFLMNYGAVRFSGGKIKLLPVLPLKEGFIPGSSIEFFLILWGERHYLVPADELFDFINDVNIGAEPSSRFPGLGSQFLLRKGDIDLKVSGRPLLPRWYRRYLLEKPINGKITAVGSTQMDNDGVRPQRTTKVILNVGKDDGVFEKMQFVIYSPQQIPENIIITRVKAHISEGYIIQTYLPNEIPAAGWRVSTSRREIK